MLIEPEPARFEGSTFVNSGFRFLALATAVTLFTSCAHNCRCGNESSAASSTVKSTPTAAQINGAPIVEIQAQNATQPRAHFLNAKIAPNAGSALVELQATLGDGRTFNLLSNKTPVDFETALMSARSRGDRFATNVLFEKGASANLWPLANRLRGKAIDADTLEAVVQGQKVRMPLNLGRGTGQTPVHLHGLLYDQAPLKVERPEASTVRTTYRLPSDSKFWVGTSEVVITQTLHETSYELHMKTTNVGQTPVPVSMGAHPYFISPSGDRTNFRVRIPAAKMVELDGFKNVFPTGKLLGLRKGSAYDFNPETGSPLRNELYDNLFTDLKTIAGGFAVAELTDEKANMRIRLTSTTKNIVGVQLYAPPPTPETGAFVALEMVTNLPDPREDLWKKTPTGMQLLKPGESAEYGYKIEISNLK